MDSLLTLPHVSAAIGFCLLALYLAILPRPIPGIPYRKSSRWHPLGDAPDFFAYFAREGSMFGLIPIRHRELGTPIMQMFVQPFGKPFVFVTDYQESKDMLIRRTKEFDRSKFFGQILQPLLPYNHMHLRTDATWKAHRWLIRDAMSPGFLHEVAAPLFWSTTQQMIELWRLKAKMAQGRPFSAKEDVYTTALEVVWHATLGSEPGAVKAQIECVSSAKHGNMPPCPKDAPAVFPVAKNPLAFDAIMTLTGSLDIPINSMVPKLHHRFALATYPSLVSSMRLKDALLRERIEAAKQKIANLTDEHDYKQYSAAIDLIMHRERILAEREGRQPNYHSRVIADELFGFLFAGHDTTSTAVCWGVKLLTANHDVQKKLREALRAAFAEANRAGEQPGIKDIIARDIPYLDATLAEMHRKALTIPAVSRTALVDATVLGHVIPKGTTVFFLHTGPGIQTPALHVDESKRSKTMAGEKESRTWATNDIEEFMPERWLKKNEKGVEEYDADAGPSLPFGAGQRGCFGRKWAQLEFRVLITLIVWNFELQQLPLELASFKAVDKATRQPQMCFVRLVESA